MNEWIKRVFRIAEPEFHDEPSPGELVLQLATDQTNRMMIRSEAHVIRVARVMPSWEDLYGRRDDE
jgi:hypothetical protein